jgi:hypothetical protein
MAKQLQPERARSQSDISSHTPVTTLWNLSNQISRLEATEKGITLLYGTNNRFRDIAIIALPTTLFGENLLTTFLDPERELETLLTSEKESVRALGMFLKALVAEKLEKDEEPPF